MKILRFILPFIFVRNWYDGSWELSRARIILFSAFIIIVCSGIAVAYILQAPMTYESFE